MEPEISFTLSMILFVMGILVGYSWGHNDGCDDCAKWDD
jgi:hypothetical protein